MAGTLKAPLSEYACRGQCAEAFENIVLAILLAEQFKREVPPLHFKNAEVAKRHVG